MRVVATICLALSLVACGGHASGWLRFAATTGAALIEKQQYRQALIELRKSRELDPKMPGPTIISVTSTCMASRKPVDAARR